MSSITELARSLRKNSTQAEKVLWAELRNRKLGGFKFNRQKPLFYSSKIANKRAFFIADFYCAEKGLLVELDGQIHDFQKEYDANRDSILAELGLCTLRFRNEDLNNIESVKKKILESLISL